MNDPNQKENAQAPEITEVEILKGLVIALAKAYQHNFEDFADSSNYSTEVKNEVGPQVYKQIFNVFLNFSTLQGTSFRELIEEISTLKQPLKTINFDRARALFNYDRQSVRKQLYESKYSDAAKAEKIKRVKKIWAKEPKDD